MALPEAVAYKAKKTIIIVKKGWNFFRTSTRCLLGALLLEPFKHQDENQVLLKCLGVWIQFEFGYFKSGFKYHKRAYYK